MKVKQVTRRRMLRVPPSVGAQLWVLGAAAFSTLVSSTLLLSIHFEFGHLPETCKTYPHLLVFPLVFMWIAVVGLGWAAYRCYRHTPQGRVFVIRSAGATFLIALLATYFEGTGDKMLMTEMHSASSPTADAAGNLPPWCRDSGYRTVECLRHMARWLMENASPAASDVSSAHPADGRNKEVEAGQRWYRAMTQYSAWRGVPNWWSVSRYLYLLQLFWCCFVVFNFYVLSCWGLTRGAAERSRYLTYVALAALGFVPWFAMRLYYNQVVLQRLFGVWQAFSGIDWIGALLFCCFVTAIIVHMFKDNFLLNVVLGIVLAIAGLLAGVIGGLRPVWFEDVFGWKSRLSTLVFVPITVVPLIWMITTHETRNREAKRRGTK